MKYIVVYLFSLITFVTKAQDLYSCSFGKPSGKPLVFLHGGPGYNSANFEITTAQRLADVGFYVVVYDRRGEGRSDDKKAKYNFQETLDDLKTIYNKYHLTKATLIGHSFGGIVATYFAEQYPEKTISVVLIGAPVSLQESFKYIIRQSKNIYTNKNDSSNLKYLMMLEKMDSSSLQYSSYCFGHAMQNGFYVPKKLSAEAKIIRSTFKTDSTLIKYASSMSLQAPQGFWKNESYTTLDLTSHLKNLITKNVKIFAMYGKDDGLYSNEQVMEIQRLVGSANLNYLDNCSHNVFIDQQLSFIDALKTWVK